MKMRSFQALKGVSTNRVSRVGSFLIVLGLAIPAAANHLAREDPPEPIFVQRAFIENDLEAGIDWERGDGSQDLEIEAGVTWVFFDRLQLGADIPLGISIPDHGSTEADLADIDFSAKWLICCDEPTGYTFVSARADVSPPTGDRSRDIGGTGSFGFSLNLGYGLTVAESLQSQLGSRQYGRILLLAASSKASFSWPDL